MLPYAAAALENHRAIKEGAKEHAKCPYASEGALFLIQFEICPR